jgi:hypothetical protein
MNLSAKYFKWHFINKPREIINTFKNLLSFGFYFFSLKQIFFSLFSPWKGISWKNSPGFDPQIFLENIIGNITSRIIGFLMRIILIAFCLAYELIILMSGIIILLLWILMPIIIILILFFAFKYV